MKKFRLVGKDFQSWKSFSLDVSGLTVIVGSSNKGKSALVRALRGILRNQVAESHIRRGQKQSELTLEIEDGITASLTRNAKTTTYKVGEEDYAKLAGEVPDPIKDLSVHTINVGSSKLDPIFAGQFDSQFMMDLSPSDLNAVFGLFSSTERLNNGKKAIGVSNAEINSQAKLLASQIQVGEVRLAELKSIEAEFDSIIPTYTLALETCDRLKSCRDELTTLHLGRMRLTAQAECHKQTDSFVFTAKKSIDTVSKLQRQGMLLTSHLDMCDQRDELLLLSTPIHLGEWHKMSACYSYLVSYKKHRQRIAAAPKPIRLDVSKLNVIAFDLETVKKYQNKKKGLFKLPKLNGLSTKKVTTEVAVLQNLRKVVTITKQIDELKNQTSKWVNEIHELHEQLHTLTQDSIQCPNCGYQISKEQITWD